MHQDSAFPDFLSHAPIQQHTALLQQHCRDRIAANQQQQQQQLDHNEPSSEDDIPHFIAPADLSFGSGDENHDVNPLVHRSWAASLLGEECERDVRQRSFPSFAFVFYVEPFSSILLRT